MNQESIKHLNHNYPFSTVIPVRITDINYGMHLSNIATVGIFHHARVLFLNENNFNEMNIDGLGVILLNSSYSFKNQAKFNTKLMIGVGIGEHSKLKFNFLYTAIHQDSGKEIATCKEEMVFFNYTKGKVAKIPEVFLKFCEENKVKNESAI